MTFRSICRVYSGFRYDVRLLNTADVVVIPSRNEPFGLVLLEAWSAEKAVVASNVGGLSENIDAFVNGIKTDVTPESLAWGINSMINEPWNAGAQGMREEKKWIVCSCGGRL